jgi:hypothetical protein
LQQQAKYLAKLGWWPHVLEIKSHYVEVLTAADSFDLPALMKSVHFPSSEQPNPQLAVDAFFLFLDKLIPAVENIARELDTGVTSYETHRVFIEDYLRQAIVPSTVFDGIDHRYPDVVALLNASAKFRLESIDSLMNNIEGQRPDIVGHRNRWMKRLELLTTKAIEDHQMLIGERGAVQDGRSFKRAHLGTTESPGL